MDSKKLTIVSEGLVSTEEACRFLGIRRSKLYQEMEKGAIPFVKLGARRLIPVRALKEYAAERLVVVRET